MVNLSAPTAWPPCHGGGFSSEACPEPAAVISGVSGRGSSGHGAGRGAVEVRLWRLCRLCRGWGGFTGRASDRSPARSERSRFDPVTSEDVIATDSAHTVPSPRLSSSFRYDPATSAESKTMTKQSALVTPLFTSDCLQRNPTRPHPPVCLGR